jgi:hypothetical protein
VTMTEVAHVLCYNKPGTWTMVTARLPSSRAMISPAFSVAVCTSLRGASEAAARTQNRAHGLAQPHATGKPALHIKRCCRTRTKVHEMKIQHAQACSNDDGLRWVGKVPHAIVFGFSYCVGDFASSRRPHEVWRLVDTR